MNHIMQTISHRSFKRCYDGNFYRWYNLHRALVLRNLDVS